MSGEYRLFDFELSEYTRFEYDGGDTTTVFQDAIDGELVEEERWLLCRFPERPIDDLAAYHFSCPDCHRMIGVLAQSGMWLNSHIPLETALDWTGPNGEWIWSES